jgi:hypothetical protein
MLKLTGSVFGDPNRAHACSVACTEPSDPVERLAAPRNRTTFIRRDNVHTNLSEVAGNPYDDREADANREYGLLAFGEGDLGAADQVGTQVVDHRSDGG